MWEHTARALLGFSARVLVLDVPGCGTKRDRDTIALGVEEVADELLSDIAAAGMDDVVLVGHSQAGTMLPVLWQRQAGSLRKLIYVSCCAPLPGQNVLEMMGYGLHGESPHEVGWPLDPETHGKEEQRLLTLCNDMEEAQARDFFGVPRSGQLADARNLRGALEL
ncbi:alpha/beta fold hydrolase [Sphingomonas cavernae]|uniref:alpha/beta fold hydrolase n=1 Tax=Sphingomonas cavernae TaxID=2320861 RepID=UPI001EE565C4|nr:alpha/beta hydrolase [Sphingomonas cavernae]